MTKGQTLVKGCTANPNFTLPAGFLVGMATAIANLEAANVLVLDNGGRGDHQLRRTRVRELEAIIKELAGYVQAQSAGDRDKIESSGFEVRRSGTPIGIVNAPANMRARSGKMPGEVDIRWDSVKGRTVYEMWICEGDPKVEENWKSLGLTSRNFHTVTVLKTDSRYFLRVNAVGSAGPGPVSNTVIAKAA